LRQYCGTASGWNSRTQRIASRWNTGDPTTNEEKATNDKATQGGPRGVAPIWRRGTRANGREEFVSRRRPRPRLAIPSGSIHLTYPTLEVDELAETCALDIADRGGAYLEYIADLLNLTRERIRQIETMALAHAQESMPASAGIFADR
jgi:hypothetical protein